MTLRRPSFLVTFGLLSAVPIVALGIALGVSLRSSIESRALANVKQSGSFVAAVGLPAYLSEEELAHGLAPLKRALIDQALTTGLVGENLDGLVLRSARGRAIFASSSQAQTATARGADFRRALAGETTARRLRVAGRDELEVTAPLTFPLAAKPSGVAHILMPYGFVAKQVAHDTRRLYLILLGGLALLYAILFPIVARVSRELRRRADENERLALHDPLTGLPNRMLFGQRIEEALADGSLSTGLVALLVIDLDEFKQVNDTHGHLAGDLLLEAVAHRLHGCVRDSDTVARLGGDEFGIVLRRPEAVSSIELVAQRVASVLQQPYDLDGVIARTRASVGVAIAPDHGSEVEVLLRRADVAMYAAKESGGGYRLAGDPFGAPRGLERLAS